MDAKPQRPLRAFAAASASENINPSKQPTHQRHKSAGKVKKMAMTGALNAPPKRTAFGDVSNTSRTLAADGAGKDRGKPPVATGVMRDTCIKTLKDKENNVQTAATTKTMTVHAAKFQTVGTVSTSAANTGNQATSKPALRNNTHAQQRSTGALAQPPIKAGAAKKATVVFNDNAARDAAVAVRPETGSAVDDLVALVDKQITHPHPHKSQPTLKTEQQDLKHMHGKSAAKTDKLIEISDDEGDVDDNETEAAYEDAVERPSHDAVIQLREETVEYGQDYKQLIDIDNNAVVLATSRSESGRYLKALPAPPVASETDDDYSDEGEDEDEDQELYDEQGYTTAHSYRSHGDNTTGGPTTMVAPSVSLDVQRELEVAKAFVLQSQTEEELEEEAWDVSMVAEYGEEIFGYMRELEDSMIPNPHYMDIQTEIQWSMRSVLMDWLVQVHHRFCLLPETLFLTVNYIDRFLSVKVVSLGKLQLVGATALFVAAKYEEINCPSVQEIVYMVDSGYSVDEILKAERFMLSMLQFELGWPGPMSFLRRISKADDYELETRTLAKYFLEVTIMDERFVGTPPSYIAAGAHCISRMFLQKGDWTLSHVHYSGYTLNQLKPLINMMFECCRDPHKHHGAVFDKYSSAKYKFASTFVETKMLNGMTLARLYKAMALNSPMSSASDPEALRAPLAAIEG